MTQRSASIEKRFAETLLQWLHVDGELSTLLVEILSEYPPPPSAKNRGRSPELATPLALLQQHLTETRKLHTQRILERILEILAPPKERP